MRTLIRSGRDDRDLEELTLSGGCGSQHLSCVGSAGPILSKRRTKDGLSKICIKRMANYSLNGGDKSISQVVTKARARGIAPCILSCCQGELVYEFASGRHPGDSAEVDACARSLNVLHALGPTSCELPALLDVIRGNGAGVPASFWADKGRKSMFDAIIFELERGALSCRSCVIHLDPNLRNWILERQHAIAIDWDTICIGHPAIDFALLLWSCVCNLSREEAEKAFVICQRWWLYDMSELVAAMKVVALMQYIGYTAVHQYDDLSARYSKKRMMPLEAVRRVCCQMSRFSAQRGLHPNVARDFWWIIQSFS